MGWLSSKNPALKPKLGRPIVTSSNTELRRGLDHTGVRWHAELAFVSSAVDGGDTIPIPMAARYRGITIRRREQYVRGQKLSPCARLLTAIKAVSCQVGFKINGPGEVDFQGAGSGAGKNGGDEILRCSGWKDIARSHHDGDGIGGFELVALDEDDGADGIQVGLAKIEKGVAIPGCWRVGKRNERRYPFRLGEILCCGIGSGGVS